MIYHGSENDRTEESAAWRWTVDMLICHREALEARYDQRKLAASEVTASEKQRWVFWWTWRVFRVRIWWAVHEHFMMIAVDFLVMFTAGIAKYDCTFQICSSMWLCILWVYLGYFKIFGVKKSSHPWIPWDTHPQAVLHRGTGDKWQSQVPGVELLVWLSLYMVFSKMRIALNGFNTKVY